MTQVAAMNKVSDVVSVVNKDIALLERGHEIRYLGANLAIGDIFDAGGGQLLHYYEYYKFYVQARQLRP